VDGNYTTPSWEDVVTMGPENEQKKSSAKRSSRGGKFVSSPRPSQRQRRTDSQSHPCKLCGANEWDTDVQRGETTCNVCGFVAEQNMIDPGAEWVNHSDGADRSRVGAPTTVSLSDKGLSTVIDKRDLASGIAKRNGMSSRQVRDWRRRATIDHRSKTRDSRARNLAKAMQFIRDRGDLSPQLRDQASGLYRKAVEKGLVTGRSIRGVTAACVYLATREAKIPRRIEDVAKSFDMSSDTELKELKRTIRLVARELGAHHISGPTEYLDKFHSDLQLPPKALGRAHEIWDSTKHDLAWQGKKPSGIAGVLLYRASADVGSNRTQSEVCKVCGVSEVTLRGLLKILNERVSA
jgi:transcription initiation factor TFIIB